MMSVSKKILYLLLFWMIHSAYAVPSLSESEAASVIARSMEQEALYWNPFPLPYTVSQKSTHKDAAFLAKLFDYGLLEREEKKAQIAGTQAAPQYEMQWRYQYNDGRNPYAPEGFYYGRAQLVKVITLSAPVQNKGVFYINAQVQWSVSGLQEWAKDKVFMQARTLRRSQESQQKPFEREVVLVYSETQQRWDIWQEPAFW